jgi:type I restriction enzyme S subunit
MKNKEFNKYPKYKHSGVEWIGEIPEYWKIKKFKHLYKSNMGATLLKTDLETDGKIPVYSATESDDIFGYVNEASVILDPGDLVIPARGNSIGFVTMVNEKSTCTQTTIYSKRITNDFNNRFLFQYLRGLREILFQFDRTAIPQITVGEIKENPIVLPPVEEQTVIANFLDEKTAKIDTLIEKKKKLIELLKEERTAVINEAVTKGLNYDSSDLSDYLDSKNNSNYNNQKNHSADRRRMKDSGIDWLGQIPEHWEVKKLKYVLSIKSGDGIKSEKIDFEGTYPVYGGNGVMGYTEKYNSDKLDIIVGRVGAKCGNVRLVDGKKWISDNALVAELFEGYDCKFISIVLESINLNSLANQNAQPLITGTLVRDKVVSLPLEIKEQLQIVQYIETETKRIDSTISKIEKEIELLQEYRTALISEVVTGKIKVMDN